MPLPPLFGCFLLNIYNIRILLPLPPLFGCFLYTSEFCCHCPLQSNIPFSSDFCTVWQCAKEYTDSFVALVSCFGCIVPLPVVPSLNTCFYCAHIIVSLPFWRVTRVHSHGRASKCLLLIRHRHEKKARGAQTSETINTNNSWVVLWPFSQCLSWGWVVLRSACDITAAVRSGIRTATSAGVYSVYSCYCMCYYVALLLLVADIMTVSKCILLQF